MPLIYECLHTKEVTTTLSCCMEETILRLLFLGDIFKRNEKKKLNKVCVLYAFVSGAAAFHIPFMPVT